MDMSKKISFGFTKLTKKPGIFTPRVEEKKDVELIECLEGQSIKILGAVEETKGPLVIPIKDNGKNLLDRVKDARKIRDTKTTESNEDNRPDSELTLDELAARQLLREAQTNAKQSEEVKVQTVPLTADNVPLEGEKEPTLEDYENVPINDFGFAMLRGMGWKDGGGIGKNPKKVEKADAPELRPKGLGLGATKMVKIDKPPPAVDKEGKELQLVKGACAKIIAGKYKGYYCEVQGLDDETGRIIVQTKIKSEVLSLNEFLVIPVTKDEFSKYSKVLNSAKYEEYKVKSEMKLESDKADRKIKQERIKEEPRSGSDSDVKITSSYIKKEPASSPVRHKTSRRSPSPRNNRKSKYRSTSRSPIRQETNERYRSRSPARSSKKEKKSGKSKFRSRSRSVEQKAKRYKRSDSSSDSAYDRNRKDCKKKKSKKSKKDRRDSDTEKYRKEKKKSKKESKKCDHSDSDSDRRSKYREKSKSSRSRR